MSARLCSLLAALLLGACSTNSGICAVQPIGQDENGIAYFRYRCAPE